MFHVLVFSFWKIKAYIVYIHFQCMSLHFRALYPIQQMLSKARTGSVCLPNWSVSKHFLNISTGLTKELQLMISIMLSRKNTCCGKAKCVAWFTSCADVLSFSQCSCLLEGLDVLNEGCKETAHKERAYITESYCEYHTHQQLRPPVMLGF